MLGQDAVNFSILMGVAITLLLYDLFLWRTKRRTFSESIWGVNQVTLAVAFALGVVIGHLLTVPG
jgi:hypothetical protein